MPFELGLAVDWALAASPKHEWFVFESKSHRLQKSLSDLNGTDPYIHDGKADRVLWGLMNALTRKFHRPDFAELDGIYRDLHDAARKIRLDGGGSLYEARPFHDLSVLARRLAQARISSLHR